MPIEGSMTWYQGEHLEVTLSVVDDDGDAVNITGWTFAFAAADRYGGTVAFAAESGDGIAIVSAAAGTVKLTVQAETTEDLAARQYVFDWWRTGTDVEAVLAFGALTVQPTVPPQ